MNTITKRFSVLLVAVVLLGACNGLFGGKSAEPETGGISLSVSTPAFFRSTVPSGQDTAIASYVFSGNGPGGAAIAETHQASATFGAASIVAGDWSFTVRGKNAASDVVVWGTMDITITASVTAIRTLDLESKTGSAILPVALSMRPAGRTR